MACVATNALTNGKKEAAYPYQAIEKLLREPLFGLRCSAYALYASAPRPKIDSLATFFNSLQGGSCSAICVK